MFVRFIVLLLIFQSVVCLSFCLLFHIVCNKSSDAFIRLFVDRLLIILSTILVFMSGLSQLSICHVARIHTFIPIRRRRDGEEEEGWGGEGGIGKRSRDGVEVEGWEEKEGKGRGMGRRYKESSREGKGRKQAYAIH